MARKYANRVLDLIEEGALDPMTVVKEALAYMSEADVEDMALWAGWVEDDEEEEEEEEEQ